MRFIREFGDKPNAFIVVMGRNYEKDSLIKQFDVVRVSVVRIKSEHRYYALHTGFMFWYINIQLILV